MATLLTCPSCGKGLLGKKWKARACPQCGNRLASATASITARAAVSHREDFTPRQPNKAAEGPSEPDQPALATPDGDAVLGWGTFRAALALAFVGGLLYVGNVLGMFVELQLRGDSGVFTNQPSSLDLVLLTLARVALPAAGVLLTAAACMSSGAPRHSLARTAGLGACVSAVAIVLLWITNQVAIEQNQLAAEAEWSATELKVLNYSEKTAATLALMLFLLAMISAARDFGRRNLAVVTVAFAVFSLIVIVSLNIIEGTAADPEGSPPIALWISLALTVGMALCFVVLVAFTRAAVTRDLICRLRLRTA